MKTNRFFTNTFAGLAMAGFLLASITPGHADDQTNAAADPATNGLSVSDSANQPSSDRDNYYGLPKEAFDRLTPEQIMVLAQPASNNTSNSAQTIAVLIPFGMFAFIGVCVWFGVSQRLKRNRMLHDTIRLMVEKGQPIPPELLQPTDPQRRPRNDLRTGLVLVGVGIGVWLMPLGEVIGRSGLIPLLVGVAFLITWFSEIRKTDPSK